VALIKCVRFRYRGVREFGALASRPIDLKVYRLILDFWLAWRSGCHDGRRTAFKFPAACSPPSGCRSFFRRAEHAPFAALTDPAGTPRRSASESACALAHLDIRPGQDKPVHRLRAGEDVENEAINIRANSSSLCDDKVSDPDLIAHFDRTDVGSPFLVLPTLSLALGDWTTAADWFLLSLDHR
jgi:hypothetical protein